jgi:hypothetical protein
MATVIQLGQGTAARIRAAMLGHPTEGLRIARQAYRISETDSDELALVSVGEQSWWVAQRVSDRLTVWAHPGEDEAHEGFERLLATGGWREAGAELAG